MSNLPMQTHVPNEVTDKNNTSQANPTVENSIDRNKPVQGRSRFGLVDLWKIQRNQRSAMAQRRSIL